ncbi:MAG: hypothetical protein ACE37F_33785 [Nannocystaceae bacterium]|nr:hypothetical protein [bacterium]
MIDFDALGAELEVSWALADRDEERFADIAADALDGLAAQFDLEAFLDTMLERRSGGRQQLAGLGAFGQPGFTTFHGEGFVVEVYVWTDSLSAIHNHPFCGAFTVLHGHSVHAVYQTSRPSRAGARGQLLDVRLKSLDRVLAGEVHKFSLRRYPLVHALIHVPTPSVSMVVRTVRTEGYYRYLPPSVALPMQAMPEPGSRRLALLETLVRIEHPSALQRVCAALRTADFETAVHLLSLTWPGADAQARAALWEANAVLHGDRRDAIEGALRRAQRIEEASAIRHGLRDPDHRLCATVLAYAESRSQVRRALGDDAGALLHAFIDEAGLFSPDEAASATIAHALVEGRNDDTILETLGAEYGHDAILPQRDAVRTYAAESIFSVLRDREQSLIP